ncbi:chemotaxis protein CheW [Colwellia sp. MT41]|nr:chemotaxis protein CheW [Colwellia sp. MT41]
MKTYLSELLTESDVAEELSHQRIKAPARKPLAHKEDADHKSLEKLLKTVSEPKEKTVEVAKVDLVPISTDKSRAEVMVNKQKSYRQGDFQAMFFDVAGLTLAVPLIELGGIHKVDKTSSLMGKPSWFKGVMLYRDEKINVVDTALWVMPEKCDEKLMNSLNYQYIIMLNDSPWGLMAENLIDTVVLRQDEVKWVESNNKRPWLAGLVKEKMCALLDVSALIQLLDKGIDIYQE